MNTRNNKRVLCFIESIGSGGAERQLTGLAVLLKQKGYAVEVCYYVKEEFYLPYLEENKVGACYLAEARSPIKRYGVMRKHILNFNPDTVISYTASSSMITCMMKALGARYNLLVSERSSTQKIDLRERFKFFMYRWADFVVPNSFAQGEFINSNFHRLSSKIRVITNFVDMEKFVPSVRKKRYDDILKIICVGRLVPAKNIPRFIEAVAVVVKNGCNIHVDWFGRDLQDDYSKQCYSNIQKHQIKDVFEFHEPSLDILQEYHHADVFCLSSVFEGFPNVLCEAMSCGLPVLCSRVCDNPSIIQEGVNGFLFNPHNIDDMANTIMRFIKIDDETKTLMGQRSREIALSLFSSEAFVGKYEELM